MENQREPASFEEAQTEYEQCVDVMQDIQAQLGDRNKCTKEGARMTATEFWEWHQKAKVKLRHVTSRVRFLKGWLKRNNPQQKSEKEELKVALGEYATHIDDCAWWEDRTCDCKLDGLLEKYGLDKLERDVDDDQYD